MKGSGTMMLLAVAFVGMVVAVVAGKMLIVDVVSAGGDKIERDRAMWKEYMENGTVEIDGTPHVIDEYTGEWVPVDE